jgi:peptide-methionine (S)-S-oxide reductase
MSVIAKRLSCLRGSRAARIGGVAVLLLLPTLTAFWKAPVHAADAAMPVPEFDAPAATGSGLQTAVLAGGCFWGVQGVFEHVKGVDHVLAGYSGGKGATANYELVSSGMTGHAESVQIRFDPDKISFGQILRIFFSVALDPTQLNRQFPDSGTQYRSEIFYTDPVQRNVAQSYIAQLDRAHVFSRPIVTRVDPDQGFFAAEAYHQDYLTRHPDSPYIATYDLPKVENLKRLFPEYYLSTPVLASSKGPSS